jgi:uncharacterized protein (DUF2235 family)
MSSKPGAGQVAFYDAGLGTDIGATALTAPVRLVQKLLGSVTGQGIKRNIADCYEFIINHHQPGDRIFLFGFSRGAYTVRSLANLLMLCGIPTAIPAGPLLRYRKMVRNLAWEAVDTVLEHGAGHPRAQYEAERFELARRFQLKYASGDGSDSNAAPYFIGVFDTVAALGAAGMRRAIIHVGLTAGVTLAAVLAAAIPAALIAALAALFGFGFWLPWLLLVLSAPVIANIGFWWREKSANLKIIRDFPKPGDVSQHYAEWKGENFDRLLSRHVTYARAANAIDEMRKDFDRVAWGSIQGGVTQVAGHDRLMQWWFAGNHSDIGGSYPEPESRLSDIALQWMCEQATAVPGGLKMGPVFVNEQKMDNTGETGPALHIFPDASGVQHSEIASTGDTLDTYAAKVPRWRWIQELVARQNWATQVRHVDPNARVHPSVDARIALLEVPQSDGARPYRPGALRAHEKFSHLYDGSASTPVVTAGPEQKTR